MNIRKYLFQTASGCFSPNVQVIHAQPLSTLMPYLVKTARGVEDLIQEVAIGIWESMTRFPNAANKCHAIKAKWCIQSVGKGVGRSVDIPKQYERKILITLVHYDAILDNPDADLSQAILTDRNSLPLDEVVIRKMDFGKIGTWVQR